MMPIFAGENGKSRHSERIAPGTQGGGGAMTNVEHTSDQVYVVRCAECKWYDMSMGICILHWIDGGYDFYCKDGERDATKDHSS